MGIISQTYKLRKAVERIEKKIDYHIKSTNQFYDPERI